MDELQEIIVAGEQVKQMIESQGWRKHIEPLLDKMIRDVLGGKDNNRWDNGSLGEKNHTEFELKELIAYKTALVNFHNGVYQYLDDMENAKDELNKLMDSKNVSDYELTEDNDGLR
jgi:hypothetical protein